MTGDNEICELLSTNQELDIGSPEIVPFTRFTFTEAVALPEEAVAIETGDLLSRLDVAQYFDAGRIPTRRHKLWGKLPRYNQRLFFAPIMCRTPV